MKKSKYSDSQIMAILKQAEAGSMAINQTWSMDFMSDSLTDVKNGGITDYADLHSDHEELIEHQIGFVRAEVKKTQWEMILAIHNKDPQLALELIHDSRMHISQADGLVLGELVKHHGSMSNIKDYIADYSDRKNGYILKRRREEIDNMKLNYDRQQEFD